MIGVVLVAHGGLARELLVALEHVAGPQERMHAVCIAADDDMETKREEILANARALDSGEGIIMLSDMFGGTPSNLAISIMDRANVEVVAGVNLPMLVKLAAVRTTHTLVNAASACQEAGRKYITVASHLLPSTGAPHEARRRMSS